MSTASTKFYTIKNLCPVSSQWIENSKKMWIGVRWNWNEMESTAKYTTRRPTPAPDIIPIEITSNEYGQTDDTMKEQLNNYARNQERIN